ncbi:uncharacterized protein SPSK_04720 [Sporothrix schenckii 1099-18]|uniref:Uncharacterized protein n=2 Tax=Sporothrix schenckii TaxID=29908 RepID=U7PWC4_SPOS1|nr:uncharacterized protein SPSK_04720 [Sporothrix schenckii 1099-18]ERS99246.1 hypothetical protein HMPREF1624_04444 [Sporothrix schenckii ATCC 58251]KJR83066.1 hypothetical protein SPSK_04720 [Sporothrix schenckii 1099-18]
MGSCFSRNLDGYDRRTGMPPAGYYNGRGRRNGYYSGPNGPNGMPVYDNYQQEQWRRRRRRRNVAAITATTSAVGG